MTSTMNRNFTTNVMTHEVIASLDPGRASELSAIVDDLALGLSSAGMLRWGAMGNTNPATYDGYRPVDTGDLGRCIAAYAAAPAWLATRIAPLMDQFSTEVAAYVADRAERQALASAADASQAVSARELFVAMGVASDVTLSGQELWMLEDALGDFCDRFGDLDDEFDEDTVTSRGYSFSEVAAMSNRLRSASANLKVAQLSGDA
jgi:hypothetical protein